MKLYSQAALLGAMLCCILSSNSLYAQDPFAGNLLIDESVLQDTSNFIDIDASSENTVEIKEAVNSDSASKKNLKSSPKNTYKGQNLDDPSLYPCEGTVNVSSSQRVRASAWGDILDLYKPGTKVTVVAKEGEWYKIEYNGNGGFAYLHYSFVDTKYAPAYDGPHPYTYGDSSKTSRQLASENNYGKYVDEPTSKKQVVSNVTTTEISADDDDDDSSSNLSNASINGPDVPKCILEGIKKAKKTKWFTTKDKCLQYIGMVAYYAGAKVKESEAIYPCYAYKPIKTLRGKRIIELKDAALKKKILPGQLVHVKAAYDKDPAYNPNTNAHHWFMYAGLKNGVPMWCDCLHNGELVTTDKMHSTMSGGRILQPQYKNYGNIRRVSAVYDPFADQR